MADEGPPEGPTVAGPPHAARMQAKGARVTGISQAVQQMAARVKDWVSAGAAAERSRIDAPPPPSTALVVSSERREPWFGPGQAIQPTAPRDDVAGRAWDYPTAYNQVTRPRRYEPIGFDTLRALADNYDLLRILIETRKDQVSKLGWSILPKKQPGVLFRPKADDRCRKIEKFLRKPDGVHFWDQWVRLVMEDQLVIDAVSLYKRKDRAGRPYALEVIDGATIQPLIDKTGRRPLAPDAAYQQVLKGMPAINYSADELYYCPRNPRPHKLYGFSPVEQIIATVNIGMRREASQLAYYTEGNVPEALIGVPETWGMAQIAEFQRYWDDQLGDPLKKRRARFLPSNVNFQPTRMDSGLMDGFDEWIARICCYALSLPPLPFVKQQNRATAQTAQDTALEEGLGPVLIWLKNLIDYAIEDFHGESDLEVVWDDVRRLDPTEQLNADMTRVQRGIISMDDVRAEMGQEAYGLPAIVFGVGPNGFISVPALKEAIEQGLDKIQPPAPPMALGPDGQPLSPEGMPMGEDPLAGASPGVMDALGAQPPQGAAPGYEEDDEEDGEGEGEGGAQPQRATPGASRRVLPPTHRDLAALLRARVAPEAQATLQRYRGRLGR